MPAWSGREHGHPLEWRRECKVLDLAQSRSAELHAGEGLMPCRVRDVFAKCGGKAFPER